VQADIAGDDQQYVSGFAGRMSPLDGIAFGTVAALAIASGMCFRIAYRHTAQVVPPMPPADANTAQTANEMQRHRRLAFMWMRRGLALGVLAFGTFWLAFALSIGPELGTTGHDRQSNLTTGNAPGPALISGHILSGG
jgi:hypothetical protein